MGQPPRWEPYLVPAGTRAANDAWRGALSAGVHRHITNPVIGIFGLAGEAYATIDPGVQPGARLLATMRVIGLSAGADWDGRSRQIDGVLSFQTAVLRGGLLGRGTMLRVDWLPGRGDALNVGIHVPFGQPLAGRTRPTATDVEPPTFPRMQLSAARLPADAETALARVSEAAAMLLAYTNLYPEESGGLNYGASYAAVTRAYAESLAEAFRIAANDRSLGDSIARHARAALLDDVIVPFDSLFGQVKESEKSIRPLTTQAHARFAGWLRDTLRASADVQLRAGAVHARWLGIIESAHASLLRQSHDSRLVWLPVQLALTPEQYDEQAEVDALVERAVGRPFTDQNALSYLRSADLPLEIARSILAARDYHLLWTHDFAGQRDDTKSLDEVSYTMVADAYLPALTQAVQRYDSTRVMPIYMIFIDQFFYERRNGRLWMDILENPLHARIKLPGRNSARESHLQRRQQELRAAVRKSWRLQQDATANGGDRWLPDAVRVNVNVMLPSDFSFRSHHIVPPFPFVPDNIMREHRKIVVYDVTEADPYRGAMMVMGVGIGEHYASPTWEDRGYSVRGPAALEARAGAVRALLGNGVSESDIPGPLKTAKSLTLSDSTREYVGRALLVHNEPGFGEKESSVARAMLYNLAPPGSVIVVPDPIWVSDTWAAMLAGAAARGCRVFVISPSTPNNPNPHTPIFALQHDVMWRLLQSRDRMREQLRQTGGELRVGLYTARAPITDVPGRAREVREGLRRAPWIRELIPFDDATLAVLDRAIAQTAEDGKSASALAQDERPRAPQLHQKSQLIARPGAIAALVRQPGWDAVLARAMRAQSQQTATFAEQLGAITPRMDSSAPRAADAILRGYEQGLSAADRKAVSFYFSVGTQNQDPRGLMLDGEATLVVSGVHAATGLVDFYYLMARSTWIDTKQELDQLVPRPKGIMARLARMIRFTL
ncbi:MAG: hypothetical protein WD825_16520 [Gemmatimonadaceae bacterium]